MQSGWRIGSLFGIPFYIDPSWLIVVTLVAFAYGSDWQSPAVLSEMNWSSGIAWLAGLLTALLLFGSVLLHELGHSLVARSQGINVNSITLFLFGGIAAIDRESKTPGQAFQVAIAGPTVSFILFALLAAVSVLTITPPSVRLIASSVAQINLVLGLFNLIPGLPLDGGQILKSLVWKITNDRFAGVRWAARTGLILGWIAVAIGVSNFFISGNISMLWIAFIGGFCIRNASAYSRMTDLQEALSGLTSADAMMRDFRVVDADLTLREFADQYVLMADSRPPMYFAASNGRYRGAISVDDLRSIERSQWDVLRVADIAHSLTEIPSARESAPITEVINRLDEEQLQRLTILTPADAVAGTIDRGDIVRALAQKINLKVPEELIQRIKEEGAYPPGLKLSALSKSMAD
ncbi:MAG: site-2 protease family protein [Thainema sp.]